MRKSCLAVLAMAILAQSDDTLTWRQGYERELRKPDGWLSLVGLHWLEAGRPDGEILPGAVFTLRDGEVRVRWQGSERELSSDPKKADLLTAGTRTHQAIERGGRFAIRVKDSESPARRGFHGLSWYPVDPDWRVVARWKPHASKQDRMVDSVNGVRQKLVASGVAEFTIRGKRFELEPFDDGDELMFVFKDRTARNATYPGGRFLYTKPARDGAIMLDFNRAENPPCAYTPYATCPLASKRNTLDIAVEAGEKRYHD